MCMKGTEEGCVLKAQQDALKEEVAVVKERLAKVESDVSKMRSETSDGLRAISTSVANLAHDFGDRMNNLDKRMVAEKEKWGETLRKIVLWTARVILAGALVAMGVATWKGIM